MRATALWLGALLCVGLFVVSAQAQHFAPGYGRPQAPDACSPGFYWYGPDGNYQGPNYYVYPPFPPYNGPVTPFAPMNPFAFHPYARSPRDFFMWTEAQESLHTRERRPVIWP